MAPAVLPYGSWPTPITSELVVGAARLPNGLRVDGRGHATEVWWSEGRPDEGGRAAICKVAADGTRSEGLAAPWNARSGVHEYGGGAWWVRDGIVWFVEWATQQIHRKAPGGEPVPITPEPDSPRALRYADGEVSPLGHELLCVREEHRADGAVRNSIVRTSAFELAEPEMVVVGPDFVADPRWRPDGAAFCWLEWDHPDMPWDANRLVVDEGGVRTAVAGHDRRESICQPTWADDGSLWFSTDRTGWWSLHRWTATAGVELVIDLGQDVGFPQWVFGQSSFALLPEGRVALVHQADGIDHLSVLEPDGTVTPVESAATSFEMVRPVRDLPAVVLVVASPAAEPHVLLVDLSTGATGVVAPPRDLGVAQAWWSRPEAIDFPTAGGATAHALFFPPTNPQVQAPADELPPLLVFIHGGPTSAARPMLQLSRQYWTSRGFAVVDVNYRGSSGYGRAYRDLLQGQWGIADVEDCVAVVRHLADAGLVDPARCCIRGGSAGGFTTLAALAFHDVFAAGASHYGVADLALLAQDTHKFEARYLDGLVGPWPDAADVYAARSPIHHLEGITVPVAIFQGLDDAVVPPNQAQVMVDGLRAQGTPVAYVTFEGEGHGFRQSANIRAALDGELSFYAQVLGFSLPPDEPIEQIEIS